MPVENLDDVRNAICEAGAGIIGNYTDCSIATKVIGTFKPIEGSNPYIGEKINQNLFKKKNQKLDVVLTKSKK